VQQVAVPQQPACFWQQQLASMSMPACGVHVRVHNWWKSVLSPKYDCGLFEMNELSDGKFFLWVTLFLQERTFEGKVPK
jgi:hypothetical protein